MNILLQNNSSFYYLNKKQLLNNKKLKNNKQQFLYLSLVMLFQLAHRQLTIILQLIQSSEKQRAATHSILEQNNYCCTRYSF